MSVAFFDLDKTLLSVNSGSLWVRRELRLGHITRLQALRAGLWLTRYHLGFASLEDAMHQAIAHLHGSEARVLRERTGAFYEEGVRTLYRPGALRALEEHRGAGERLVLLTSSSNYLSELVARDLRLDGILCTSLEVDGQGLHTGRAQGELCFGQGKRLHAEAYARQVGVPLSACAFYTDSYADLPVLEVVGRPVVVHPDPRLRREALRRGWPIVTWGQPAAGGARVDPAAPPGL